MATIPMKTNVGQSVTPQLAMLSPAAVAGYYSKVIGANEQRAQAFQDLIASATNFGKNAFLTGHVVQKRIEKEEDEQATAEYFAAFERSLINTKKEFMEKPPTTKGDLDKWTEETRQSYMNEWHNNALANEKIKPAASRIGAKLHREMCRELEKSLFSTYASTFQQIVQRRKSEACSWALSSAQEGNIPGFLSYVEVARTHGAGEVELAELRVKAAGAYLNNEATMAVQSIERANDEMVDSFAPDVIENVKHILDFNNNGALDSEEEGFAFKNVTGAAEAAISAAAGKKLSALRAQAQAEQKARDAKKKQERTSAVARAVDKAREFYVDACRKGREENVAEVKKSLWEGVDTFFNSDRGAMFVSTFYDGDERVARKELVNCLQDMFKTYSDYAHACEQTDRARFDKLAFNTGTEVLSLLIQHEPERIAAFCHDNGWLDKNGRPILSKIVVLDESSPANPGERLAVDNGKGGEREVKVMTGAEVFDLSQALLDAKKANDTEALYEGLCALSVKAVRRGDLKIIKNILEGRALSAKDRIFISDFVRKCTPMIGLKDLGVSTWVRDNSLTNAQEAYLTSLNEIHTKLLANNNGLLVAEGGTFRAEMNKIVNDCCEAVKAGNVTDKQVAALNRLRLMLAMPVMPVKIKLKQQE